MAAGAEFPDRPGRPARSGRPRRPQATRACATLLNRVPVSGDSSTGISRDDYIGQVAKDIENKMPQVFDLEQVRKHLGLGISPTSVVLLQELERFNKLVFRMARSLAELQRVSVAGSPWARPRLGPLLGAAPAALAVHPESRAPYAGLGGRSWDEQRAGRRRPVSLHRADP